MNIVLSVLSIVGTMSSIIFAFLAFFKKEKESNLILGKKEGILSNDILYIKSTVDNIKMNLEKVENNYNQLNVKFVKLDQQMKNFLCTKYDRKDEELND